MTITPLLHAHEMVCRFMHRLCPKGVTVLQKLLDFLPSQAQHIQLVFVSVKIKQVVNMNVTRRNDCIKLQRRIE